MHADPHPGNFLFTADGRLGIIDFGCVKVIPCLLYTSDAADERSSVDLGGRRIIKKKNRVKTSEAHMYHKQASLTGI